MKFPKVISPECGKEIRLSVPSMPRPGGDEADVASTHQDGVSNGEFCPTDGFPCIDSGNADDEKDSQVDAIFLQESSVGVEFVASHPFLHTLEPSWLDGFQPHGHFELCVK